MSEGQEAVMGMDAADGPAVDRKLTEPLANTVWAILCFVVAALIAGLIIAAVTPNVTVLGFGHYQLCTDVGQNGLVGTGNDLAHVRPGVYSSADTMSLCVAHPTLGQRLLVTLTAAPTIILYLAVLVQLWLLILAVRRAGPFARTVSRRLRVLAWFILPMTLAAGAVQGAAKGLFAASAVTTPVYLWTDTINGVLGSSLFPLFLVVCGLLTLARIIRIGAQLHDDLAGTV